MTESDHVSRILEIFVSLPRDQREEAATETMNRICEVVTAETEVTLDALKHSIELDAERKIRDAMVDVLKLSNERINQYSVALFESLKNSN